MLLRVVQSMVYLVEGIEVILDVLEGAVFGELMEKRLDLLFRGGYGYNQDSTICYFFFTK